MTDRPDPAPTRPKTASPLPRDRLAAALKANMARRKGQAKARGAGDGTAKGDGEAPGAPTTTGE